MACANTSEFLRSFVDCSWQIVLSSVNAQLTFTYSNSTIETLEKGVKYVQN